MIKFEVKMKKEIILFLSVLFIVSNSYSDEEVEKDCYANVISETPIYSKQSENSLQLGLLNKDEKVLVIDIHENWVLIEYKDIKGWVLREFLKCPPPPLPPRLIINIKKANLRSSPDLKSKIVGSAIEGDLLIPDSVTKKGDWYRVKLKEGSAWISNSVIIPVESPEFTDGILIDSSFIMDKPSTDANKIKLIESNTLVGIIGKKDDWLLIETNEKLQGWINQDFIMKYIPIIEPEPKAEIPESLVASVEEEPIIQPKPKGFDPVQSFSSFWNRANKTNLFAWVTTGFALGSFYIAYSNHQEAEDNWSAYKKATTPHMASYYYDETIKKDKVRNTWLIIGGISSSISAYLHWKSFNMKQKPALNTQKIFETNNSSLDKINSLLNSACKINKFQFKFENKNEFLLSVNPYPLKLNLKVIY